MPSRETKEKGEGVEQIQHHYGLRMGDVTQERLVQVLRIYGTITGVTNFIDAYGEKDFASAMAGQLKAIQGVDLRLGSRLTGHTKLMGRLDFDIEGQRVVKLYLNPNIPQTSGDFRQGEAMAAEFSQAVGEYLQREGIAQQLVN